MPRFGWNFSLLLLLSFAWTARADSLSVVLELEGTLSKRTEQWVLSVEGEGDWILDLSDEALRDQAEATVKRGRNWKVVVAGSVRARTAGSALQLRDRKVQVSGLFSMVPGFRIDRVFEGSPAAAVKLQVGDIVHEINEREITSEKEFVQILSEYRGREVSIVVRRDGRGKLFSGVSLRRENSALGVDGSIVWSRQGLITKSPLPETKPPLPEPQ